MRITNIAFVAPCKNVDMLVQGTKVEGTIGQLFEGHMHMFIECINVDYKSTRQESFMDLQLDVKGCKNIYDSFDKYCEVEVMDGQNQYKTDDHGLQARTSCFLHALHNIASPCSLMHACGIGDKAMMLRTCVVAGRSQRCPV